MALYYCKDGFPFKGPPYTDEENWEFEQRLRRGGDIGREIYARVVWAQEHLPYTPSTVKTISRHYDTEKYKAIATPELKRTSPEVLEGGALKCAWWEPREVT